MVVWIASPLQCLEVVKPHETQQAEKSNRATVAVEKMPIESSELMMKMEIDIILITYW